VVTRTAASPADGDRILAHDVRRARERWAGGWDGRAVLAQRTREELLSRLDLVRVAPARVLDAGAATGAAALALARRYREARVVAVDPAAAMCRRARRRRGFFTRFDVLQADLGALPLADGAMDLVFSNLALQQCDPLDAALGELRRVLSPGGLFTFATLGPDTLRELRGAWRDVDDLPHVHPFVDMHDLGEALLRCGFGEPVLDVEQVVLTYPDWAGLVAELRALGGASALAGRRRTLTGRRRMASLAAAYGRYRERGVLPATCEIVFGHAWATGRARGGGADGGEVRIPASRIGRPPRRRDTPPGGPEAAVAAPAVSRKPEPDQGGHRSVGTD
jgi:malonyl-CoA O-methyltransferase